MILSNANANAWPADRDSDRLNGIWPGPKQELGHQILDRLNHLRAGRSLAACGSSGLHSLGRPVSSDDIPDEHGPLKQAHVDRRWVSWLHAHAGRVEHEVTAGRVRGARDDSSSGQQVKQGIDSRAVSIVDYEFVYACIE